MNPERALKLGIGALSGLGLGEKNEGFTIWQVHNRVSSRYPEAMALPSDPKELESMLQRVGIDVRWESGSEIYRRREAGFLRTSGSSIGSRRDTATSTRHVDSTSPENAQARQDEDRLQHAYRDGGFLVLTVRPSRMRDCERELLHHFLLGGFSRLFDLWIKREDNDIVAAQKALDGVWGCDINPFAVAIARFRLVVVALRACGIKSLKKAPAWNIHLATGDSLLFGSRWDREGKKKGEQQFFSTDEESWAPEIYACEDKDALSEVLGQQYHAVVGNPPYITVKDRVLNAAYRDRYAVCAGKYSLSVPFVERFFDLSHGGDGFVGQITSNSFMKREFGKKLIQDFFPVTDLTHVVDTSGAYIPGHGTPTVILFGRNRLPQHDSVRAVLGIKGEPSTPADPAQGLVWRSIIHQIDNVDSEDLFNSTADVPRSVFAVHPWSIGGGGAAELKETIEASTSNTLSGRADIGVGVVTLEDDVFHVPLDFVKRMKIPDQFARGFVVGDIIRDWHITGMTPAIFPHDGKTFKPVAEPIVLRLLWPFRTGLSNRTWFRKTQIERGMKWFEYGHISADKFRTPLSIAFAFVATHNHFVLDRGGNIFKQSAPIIKLRDGATEEAHLSILGLLNSSTACFWLKQTFHNKGSTVDQHGARQRTAAFEDFYEFTSTGLKRFPLPEITSLSLVQKLDNCAREYLSLLPATLAMATTPTGALLHDARKDSGVLRGQMISLQEEVDWDCYQIYDLLGDDLCYHGDDLPTLVLGQRAFEIVMARQMAKGELETTWFERHGSKPITEIPPDWPEDYRKLVQRRIELIETNKSIGLIEKPEYKRRWNTESWTDQQQRAVRNWLLERLESTLCWPNPEQHDPRLQSVSKLADKVSNDQDFMQVAAIYRSREDFDLSSLIAELVGSESVPLLPKLRCKTSGLRKREVWEKTWELQRKEDAGEEVGQIKVPPKYTSADFQKSDYWRLRGKLDVPKERWISFPHCETEGDPSLVVGWAGWNHLQQGTAIVAYYDARKNEGWSAERLTPLLAALDQLLPWIHQWHPEIDPEYNETAGTSFQTLLESEAQELGLTLEQIRSWTPPAKKKAAKKKAAKKPRKKKVDAEADE